MIPNVIHFIYGLSRDFGGKPFCLSHFLAVKSAFLVNKPEKIFIYYKYEPSGEWWQKTKKYAEPICISVPSKIFGNKLLHYAHQADVLRLLILTKYGGIYLDLDTICIKPFTSFLNYECVMGIEKPTDAVRGLCNALIMASTDSKFLQYWLSSYKNFRSTGRDQYWGEHSVLIPWKIANLYPDLIHIEKPNSFFNPSYTSQDIRILFEECHEFPDAYIFHLWESFSYSKHLNRLSESEIKSICTTYNLVARKYLQD